MKLQQVGLFTAAIKSHVLFFCAFGILAFNSVSPSARVFADNYVFDVLYYGEGNASLAPGSDDPNGTSLVPGDTFQWTITAQNNAYWLVQNEGDFFPLMAMTVDPSGDRTGNFTFNLLNDGSEVFELIGTDEVTSLVHIGTNSVSLPTGMEFDEMRLDYSLTSAVDDVTADPVASDLGGPLPIFGAPEFTVELTGFGVITYVVPEPATGFLLVLSLAGLGWRRR